MVLCRCDDSRFVRVQTAIGRISGELNLLLSYRRLADTPLLLRSGLRANRYGWLVKAAMHCAWSHPNEYEPLLDTF